MYQHLRTLENKYNQLGIQRQDVHNWKTAAQSPPTHSEHSQGMMYRKGKHRESLRLIELYISLRSGNKQKGNSTDLSIPLPASELCSLLSCLWMNRQGVWQSHPLLVSTGSPPISFLQDVAPALLAPSNVITFSLYARVLIHQHRNMVFLFIVFKISPLYPLT